MILDYWILLPSSFLLFVIYNKLLKPLSNNNCKKKIILLWWVIHKMLITLIFPLLMCERVPISNTGVFPVRLFSCRGPSFGRLRPYLAVSPIMRWDMKRRNWSTNRAGNHLRRHMLSPKVDLPSISWGKTCTYKRNEPEELKKHKNGPVQ